MELSQAQERTYTMAGRALGPLDVPDQGTQVVVVISRQMKRLHKKSFYHSETILLLLLYSSHALMREADACCVTSPGILSARGS